MHAFTHSLIIHSTYHATRKAGDEAHGWLHVKFGFSSAVHISMVIVAPCFSMFTHEFFASL
jgi:hypothetical protein